jgi:hypothetical protein
MSRFFGNVPRLHWVYFSSLVTKVWRVVAAWCALTLTLVLVRLLVLITSLELSTSLSSAWWLVGGYGVACGMWHVTCVMCYVLCVICGAWVLGPA